MKVVHVSTSDNGGAGLAAYRLHRGLLEQGVESRMIVANRTKSDDTIVQAEQDKNLLFQPPKNALLRKFKKIMRRRGKYLTHFEYIQKEIERLHNLYPQVFYTSPISTYDLSNHPLIQEADIIHLHWIQNFVNFDTFFNNVNKPIIWTLHDLNPMMGGFHHLLWKNRYYEEYKKLEDDFYGIKKQAICNARNLSIVAISKQMHNMISKHEFFNGRNVYDIHNSVDGQEFSLINQTEVRKVLSIPIEKKVFLFVNGFLNDETKGLDNLIEAIKYLKPEDSMLICVGNGKVPSVQNIPIRHFSAVSDTEWLSLLYSTADFLVLPSLQEGLSQTSLESLCCGTPVISTPVSGSEDIINNSNGVICSDYTPKAIAEGIASAMQMEYDRSAIRKDILERFGIEKNIEKHLNVYNTISIFNSDVTLTLV